MTNAFEQAALIPVVNVLEALQQFRLNLGTDPVVAVAKLPAALVVLEGQIALQGPALAQSEFAAVMNAGGNDLTALIAKVKAKEVPSA